MAEKILQTRIVNKNADLSTWNSSTLALKQGEIALAKFDAKTVSPLDGSITTTPAYAIKVGVDGEKAFKDCAWLYAPASDVHAWAKAEVKPDYTSTEISRGEDKGTVEAALVAIEAALGDSGSVAEAIKAAIEALDVEDTAVEKQFVTAVAEADGKISVTRRALAADDIPTLEISKINGLQDTLDANANTAAEATKAVADDLAAYKTANDAAVDAVRTTAEAATTVEEATAIAQGLVDALAGTGNTSTVKKNADDIAGLTADLAALAGEGRTTETVKGNADAIATLAQRIGDVANVMNFRGVSSTEGAVGADIADPKAGDVIIYGEAEYVYDETGAWVKFGDASDNAAAISELQTRVGNIETKNGQQDEAITAAQTDATSALTAIDVINGTEDGSIAKAVADAKAELEAYADKAEEDAVASANAYTDGKVETINAAASDLNDKVDAHIADKENPHEVTKEQVGLGNVDNKSVETIKTEFTGAVAEGDTGFVTGGDVFTAVEAAKTAAQTEIDTIKANYARVDGDKLVFGQGDDVMTIVFDCGGAE